MKIKIISAFLLATMLPAAAQQTGPIVAGHGNNSCSDYTQGRLIAAQLETSYFDWAQGFMSSTNTMLDTQKENTRNLNAISDDNQKKALRDYCNAHPKDPFQLAVVKLFFSFPLMK